jgi:hypothetical protein
MTGESYTDDLMRIPKRPGQTKTPISMIGSKLGPMKNDPLGWLNQRFHESIP